MRIDHVGLAGAIAHRSTNLLDVVGDALAHDDVGGQQREPRDDHVAAAVVAVDATAAVAHRDLRATPAPRLGINAHAAAILS